MKLNLTFFISLFFIQLTAQITAVRYELQYNKKEKTTDVYLIIVEGQTNPEVPPHRIQFNSQVGIVVPKGTPLEIIATHNPLQDNREKKGTKPSRWESVNPMLSPNGAPKSDFYSIRPVISPTAFYNELKAGDRIKLFTLGTNNKNCKKVRLFDLTKDPQVGHPGMQGRNFTNAFCLGSAKQLYSN
jgi:hypothetical protein